MLHNNFAISFSHQTIKTTDFTESIILSQALNLDNKLVEYRICVQLQENELILRVIKFNYVSYFPGNKRPVYTSLLTIEN